MSSEDNQGGGPDDIFEELLPTNADSVDEDGGEKGETRASSESIEEVNLEIKIRIDEPEAEGGPEPATPPTEASDATAGNGRGYLNREIEEWRVEVRDLDGRRTPLFMHIYAWDEDSVFICAQLCCSLHWDGNPGNS